jgi:hypothetical protein
MKEQKHAKSSLVMRFLKKTGRAVASFFSKILVSPRLKHQIQMLQLSLEGKETIIKQLEKRNSEMEDQYKRLREKTATAEIKTRDKERENFFHLLEPVLVQVSVLGDDLKKGVEIPIEEVIYILETIPEKIRDLEIKQYIKVGNTGEFDPKKHIPVVSQVDQIFDGDKIICIIPGFEYKGTILLRSEVRKTED